MKTSPRFKKRSKYKPTRGGKWEPTQRIGTAGGPKAKTGKSNSAPNGHAAEGEQSVGTQNENTEGRGARRVFHPGQSRGRTPRVSLTSNQQRENQSDIKTQSIVGI